MGEERKPYKDEKELVQSHREGQLCRQDPVQVCAPRTNLKSLGRRGSKGALKSVTGAFSTKLPLTFSKLWFL